MLLIDVIRDAEAQLTAANVSFGHGTNNAFDEAVWLVLWSLGLPLDTPLDDPKDNPDSLANRPLTPTECAGAASILGARILTRKPVAYLTHEAWLQGVSFYVDERVIIPRSLIAELVVNGGFDYWLHPKTLRVLDLCTGNGSLAILTAMVFPEVTVVASDLSKDALAVASINLDKHQLAHRVELVESDGLTSVDLRKSGTFELILCNPPYVNADSMSALPPEYRAEPFIALDGNASGSRDGMDFIRSLLTHASEHLTPLGVLVLEIGNERANFEAAFPHLDVVWLDTSAGDDQVLLLTREALLK
ncbi:MAG: 50S ribosomal protein L3 N(5)-glutamine methyltransferase [Burkholderiales bacterium PBB4]|nr:MAG: 50S ribosomal protein L3 N(5)-glutamine methyltransferase [Burkholderiales bacterium PBB4]